MRCVVCYRGRTEMYVCEGCAAGASSWDERFGWDDAQSTSSSEVSAGTQARLNMLVNQDQARSIACMTNWGIDRERWRKNCDPRLTRRERERLAAMSSLPPWHWAYQSQQRARARQPDLFWKAFGEMWAKIGLTAWTDQLSGTKRTTLPPGRTRRSPVKPERKIGKEVLARIVQQEEAEAVYAAAEAAREARAEAHRVAEATARVAREAHAEICRVREAAASEEWNARVIGIEGEEPRVLIGHAYMASALPYMCCGVGRALLPLTDTQLQRIFNRSSRDQSGVTCGACRAALTLRSLILSNHYNQPRSNP